MVKFEVNSKDCSMNISISTSLYPLDVIYAVSYIFLDKNYIILDGDPKKDIIVTIIPKNKGRDLDRIGKEFANELITYSFYKTQSEKNSKIREAIMQAALLPSEVQVENRPEGEYAEKNAKEDDSKEDSSFDDMDFMDDPEGIAIPWEEKYGSKKTKKDKTC